MSGRSSPAVRGMERGQQRARRRTALFGGVLLASWAVLAVARAAFVGSAWRTPQRGLRVPSAAAGPTAAESELQIRSPDYWDERYRTRNAFGQGEHVDDRGMGWYCEYAGPLQQTLQAVVGGQRGARILNVGCGVDRLAADIYFDGFTNLLSTDISPAAVQEMSATTASSMPEAEWQVDDVMEMKVPSASVDVVVDKGTLDAVMLSPTLFSNAAKMLREVQRVLKLGGTYIVATHGRGDPKTSRVPLLQLPHLSFNVQVTPDLGGFHLIVAQKIADLPEAAAAARWEEVVAWAADMDRQDAAAEAASMAAPPASAAAPAGARAPPPPVGARAPPPAAAQAQPAAPAPAPAAPAAMTEAELAAQQQAEWARIEEDGQ